MIIVMVVAAVVVELNLVTLKCNFISSCILFSIFLFLLTHLKGYSLK